MRKLLYNLATDKDNGFTAGLVKFLLFVLSCIYGLLVRLLISFYRQKSYRLNCKVISVGNITLGGTGKTLLVEYIGRYLKDQGYKLAIISRGYKRKLTQYAIHNTQYETMGDEPYMLAKNLGDIPVIVDADRIRGATGAIRDYGVDTVILDDGFQQWKISKDLEIVTVDATNPFGNRHLIPRGILREPLVSLRRADVCLLTKTSLCKDIHGLKDFLISINPGVEIFESTHKPVGFYHIGNSRGELIPEMLKGKTATLFSGIADPGSFEDLITALGINTGLHFRFPDHYHYSQVDLDRIAQASKEKKCDILITTEKDAARLCAMRNAQCAIRIFVLRIKIEIKNEEGFHHRLLRLYSA